MVDGSQPGCDHGDKERGEHPRHDHPVEQGEVGRGELPALGCPGPDQEERPYDPQSQDAGGEQDDPAPPLLAQFKFQGKCCCAHQTITCSRWEVSWGRRPTGTVAAAGTAVSVRERKICSSDRLRCPTRVI